MPAIHPVYGYPHTHIADILKNYGVSTIIDMGGRKKLKQYIKAKVLDANINKGIDATKLPFSCNMFDAAVSIATLEHVEDQAAFLMESIRVAGKVVVHWFPYGSGAEKTEKFKWDMGHRHVCKLPSKEVVDKFLGEVNNGMLYPLMSSSEHLLLLASYKSRMNKSSIYKYVFEHSDLTYGYIFMGTPR